MIAVDASAGPGFQHRVFGLADRYLPTHLSPDAPSPEAGDDHDTIMRSRIGILVSWLGVFFAGATAVSYASFGSPVSAMAIGLIAVSLLFVPGAIRRGVALALVGNTLVALTWIVTFVVASRTGGFSSPAIAWAFLHPIITYIACGRRSSTVWSMLSVLQVASLWALDRSGFVAAQDLSPAATAALRAIGFVGCIAASASVIAGTESVRRASQEALDRANRALDRQRILGDMHDGIGSQLMGLMIQVRARRIDDERLLQGLGSCLDDLKLIVDSLDPAERSFEVAVGELRARMEPRCSAAGVELAWTIDGDAPCLGAERTLQVLRALQEMTSNALRHAHGSRIDVRMSRHGDRYEVAVSDDGVGFDPAAPPRAGRGLASLRARAMRLGGGLTIGPAAPGTIVRLCFPL